MTTREVYADHAATTRPAPAVVQAMLPWLTESFGNPSSVHRRGETAREAIENARFEVARLMGAQPEEIVFTASGSESDNLALKGAMLAAPQGRRRLVTTAVEHAAVLETAKHLQGRGWELTVVPVRPNGAVDPGAIAEVLGDDVALVSVMAVNNETGVIQPVEDIGPLVHECGALFHVDAVQAAGKRPIAVDLWQADLASIAAHKLYGAPGAAALFVRRRTENVPALVGFGAAAAHAMEQFAAGEPERLAALGDQLLAGLLARVPDMMLNGDLNRRVGAIVNVRFAGVDGEAVLHELDREGITVSTGSACSAATPGPSHVLIAMGLEPEDAHASVRFSLGEPNTDDDVTRLLDVVPAVVERLRALGGAHLREGAR